MKPGDADLRRIIDDIVMGSQPMTTTTEVLRDALAAAYDRGVQDTIGAAQETINDYAQRLAQVHIAVRRALEAVPRTGPVEDALAELDRWQTDMMAAAEVTG